MIVHNRNTFYRLKSSMELICHLQRAKISEAMRILHEICNTISVSLACAIFAETCAFIAESFLIQFQYESDVK